MKFTISIDRQAKSIAVFQEDFECVADFEGYTDEESALRLAQVFCRKRGDNNPEVVYPRITKFSAKAAGGIGNGPTKSELTARLKESNLERDKLRARLRPQNTKRASGPGGTSPRS